MQEMTEPEDADNDGYIGFGDHVDYWFHNMRYKLGWEHHKHKYYICLATLLWMCIGCVYVSPTQHISLSLSLFVCVCACVSVCLSFCLSVSLSLSFSLIVRDGTNV